MLVHALVVDTSNLFPHFFGLPYRRSLKSLAKSYLKRDIQTGTHDSLEDARASLELVLCKVMLLEYEIHYTFEMNLITPGTAFFDNLYHDIFQVKAESEEMSKALKGNKDTNAADYSQHSMSSQFSQLGNNNALLNASIGGMNSSGILFNNNAMNPGVLPHVSTQSSISQVSTFLPHRPGIK